MKKMNCSWNYSQCIYPTRNWTTNQEIAIIIDFNLYLVDFSKDKLSFIRTFIFQFASYKLIFISIQFFFVFIFLSLQTRHNFYVWPTVILDTILYWVANREIAKNNNNLYWSCYIFISVFLQWLSGYYLGCFILG